MPPGPAVQYPMTIRTDGMAIGALVVGLVGLLGALFSGVPGIILGSVAVFLGLRSRGHIKRSGGALQGGGLALAGWIVGLCAIALGLAYLLIIVGFFFMSTQSGGVKGG